jgi:hypothetical protein
MATAFTFEAVADDIPAGGEEVSLALDKAGNPRIAFAQQGSGQIIVARRDGGTWTHERVDSGFVGLDSRACLAIDSQGNPQLAYRDLTGGDLIHAVKNAGQWSFTNIPTRLTPDHGVGGVGRIAFALHPGHFDTESRDAGFFVYRDLATDGIGFAHTGKIGPTPVTVQNASPDLTTFDGPSATFDPSEGFFVAYVGIFQTGSPQDSVSIRSTLIVDIEKGTFGEPLVIESSQFINVRRPTSIVRTFSDSCLAYFDIANKTVKAHFSTPGLAQIETVATNVNNIVTPSAAANRGDFRIAYADSDAIKLASRSRSGVWTVEMVDAVSGGSPSLAYDNSGTAHIAYIAGGGLKYARRSE